MYCRLDVQKLGTVERAKEKIEEMILKLASKK